MSDIAVGTARIIVRPDTTRFRAELQAELRAITAGLTVPAQVVPVTAGAGLAAVQTQAATTAASLRTVTEEQLKGAEAARRAAKADTERVRTLRQVQTAAIAQGAAITGLRGAVLTAGAAFLGATIGIQAFTRSIQTAAQLESDLNVFRVTAQATAEEMERVREEAKLLGRDLALPGVTATDAAQTFLTLSRAGLSVQDALAGARGTLQLATAAQIQFSDAAQLTASALNAFALRGESAVDVADLLTNAANASQASIADMGIALRQSAAIADLVGFSLSETVTFLTQLAQAGLAGSDAGTSFRVAIQRLIAPTDKARDALEGLNVNLRDAQGNLRPEAFFELGDALERLGRAQGDATRQIIFGNDASRAAAFFARLNADSFREQERALERQGSAAEVAGARNEGFAGQVENLKNQITALGIELGELSLPAAGLAADALSITFGTLATQISDTREAFAESADQVRDFAAAVSQASGFDDFAGDVASGARLIQGDLERAADSARDFFGSLLSGGDSGESAARSIRVLTEEERRLAAQLTDSSDRVDIQERNFEDLVTAAERAAGAIARLTGQIAGLEEQRTRARIAGDEGAEFQLLEQERQRIQRLIEIQEEIVAEGGRGAATARRRIRDELLPQLEGITSDIRRIREQQAAAARNAAEDVSRAAEDAARAQREAERDFLDLLSQRRDDAARRQAAASATENLNDDIAVQNRLQALIQQQIAKIRERVRDERLRAAAIRELRIALIESRQAEEELRQEQLRAAQERAQESAELDVDLAVTVGNVAREVAARQRLIALLRKQQATVKRGTIEWKRLRNEIAAQQEAIEDAQKQNQDAQKEGRTFSQQAFEFLQAQQGFAANLFGNLIPTGAAAGLVGNVEAPAAQISVAAGARAARDAVSPTAGQANVTNDILRRILRQLIALNRGSDAPEGRYQRQIGSAFMDGPGGGSLDGPSFGGVVE